MNEETEIQTPAPQDDSGTPEAPTLDAPSSEDVDQTAQLISYLESEAARLAELNEALKDENLRMRADMQNMRKRQQLELERFRTFANESLIVQILPVLDNFDRAIAAGESGATSESLLEGLKAVDRQLLTALEAAKVVRVADVGTPFDPEQHEAILTEVTDEHPEDTVVHILESGYRLADKVIRPAKVRVSKKP